MATSGRRSELHHPDVLEDELQRRQAGDVPDIQRRGDFIDVESGQPHAAELPQEVEQLARGQPARRGDARPGCDRGVERVDVERDMESVAADAGADLVGELTAGPAVRDRGRNQRDAHLANELDLFPVVVTASEQRDFPWVDLAQLEATPQGAAIRPAAMSE